MLADRLTDRFFKGELKAAILENLPVMYLLRKGNADCIVVYYGCELLPVPKRKVIGSNRENPYRGYDSKVPEMHVGVKNGDAVGNRADDVRKMPVHGCDEAHRIKVKGDGKKQVEVT